MEFSKKDLEAQLAALEDMKSEAKTFDERAEISMQIMEIRRALGQISNCGDDESCEMCSG